MADFNHKFMEILKTQCASNHLPSSHKNIFLTEKYALIVRMFVLGVVDVGGDQGGGGGGGCMEDPMY